MSNEVIKNIKKVVDELLGSITDYEDVELTDEEYSNLLTKCEGCRDNDEVECEINKFLIGTNYTYNEEKFGFEKSE